MTKREAAKRSELGPSSAKLDRVIGRQTGRRIRGFDVTILPGDYGPNLCSFTDKCIRHNAPDGTRHEGECWPT